MRALIAIPLLALTGCFSLRGPGPEVAAADYHGEPCLAELEAIRHATFGEQARVALRYYMSCLVESGQPPVDLEARVADALRRNPYPALGRERDAVLAGFFDRKRVKSLPGNLREMQDYIQLLEDQALAARAVGDVKLAEAAEARAAKVRGLFSVLEDVQG